MIEIEDRLRVVTTALRKSGIRVLDDPNIQFPAQVGFESGAYTIRLTPQGVPSARLYLLLHEVGHILRGDLELLKKESGKPGFDWKALMMSMDSHINKPSLERLIEPEGDIFPGHITWPRLRQTRPDLPEVHPPTLPLYELLKESDSRNGKQCPGLDGFGTIPSQVSRDELQQARVRALLKLREMPGLPDEMRAIINQANGQSLTGPGGRKRVSLGAYKPEALASIDRLLKTIRGLGGNRRFTRTWMYPCWFHNQIRGAVMLPRPNLYILIDASGSMTDWMPQIRALTQALHGTHELRFVIHTHEVVSYDGAVVLRHPPETFPTGGTAFVPAYRLLASVFPSPDAIVHLTDRETHDERKALGLVACPVILASPPEFDPELVP